MRPLLPTTLATLALAALPGAALAGDDDQPDADRGTTCSIVAQQRYHVDTALRRGMRVRITCDGPARVSPTVSAKIEGYHPTSLEMLLLELYPRGHGDEGGPQFVRFERAGTKTYDTRFAAWIRPLVRRAAPTRVALGLGVEQQDGSFRSPRHVEVARIVP